MAISKEPEVEEVDQSITDVSEEKVTYYKPPAISTQDSDLTSVLGSISGTTMQVDYYNQIKNTENNVNGLDTNLDASQQQYKLIRSLDLKVTSFIGQGEITEISGEAIIDAGVFPYINDVIVIRMMDNKIGEFKVTSTDDKSYVDEHVYPIVFGLNRFIDSFELAYDNLKDKVVIDETYVEGHRVSGNKPTIETTDYINSVDLYNKSEELVKQYIRLFVDRESDIFKMPEQNETVHGKFADPCIEQFFRSVINATDYFSELINVNTFFDPYANTESLTILDAISKREPFMLGVACRKVRLFNGNINSYFNTHITQPAYYDIDQFVRPMDDDVIGEVVKDIYATAVKDITVIENIKDTDPLIIPNTDHLASTYIFTNKFYNGLDGLSILETITLQFINQENIDINNLILVVNDYKNWTKLQKYYYIPILIAILKYTVESNINI